MRKVIFKLTGNAETLFNSLENKGMPESTILGKALYCLDMVLKGDFVAKDNNVESHDIDELSSSDMAAQFETIREISEQLQKIQEQSSYNKSNEAKK